MNKKELRAMAIARMKELDEVATKENRSLTDEEKKEFSEKEAEARKLGTEIEAEEREMTLKGFSFSAPNPIATAETNSNEERAKQFMATGRTQMRALLSTGTIAKPNSVSSDISGLAEIGDSIVDDVHAVSLSGNGSWVVAYKATKASAADITDGSEIGGTGAGFEKIEITPSQWGVLDTISNQVKKLTPLSYESEIQRAALIALREKAANVIISKIADSTLADKKTYALDATYIRNLVLGFRSIAGKGNVKLYISQADLITLGSVRGTNEKKPVYEITFDAGTTTSGTIKDGGTAVQFRVLDGLSEGTQYFGQPGAVDMPMWDNYKIETDEGGNYFASNLMAIRGIQTANADLVAKGGMQIVGQA